MRRSQAGRRSPEVGGAIHRSGEPRGSSRVAGSGVVARLYRFRWQIELVFKEWKSYANLHKLEPANEHVAEGLIWASLCAAVLKRFLAHAAQLVGGKPISNRRVAMCAGHIIDEMVTALPACVSIAAAFRMRWRSCWPTHDVRTLVAMARPDDSGPVSLSSDARKVITYEQSLVL
jgi:hypothetical protein